MNFFLSNRHNKPCGWIVAPRCEDGFNRVKELIIPFYFGLICPLFKALHCFLLKFTLKVGRILYLL